MTHAVLEHANISVSDPERTAGFLCDAFNWKIRWSGEGIQGGRTIHVGNDDNYLAIYTQNDIVASKQQRYKFIGALNHIGVVVDDLKPVEERVVAAGYKPGEHHDYEPGERFYFLDHDGIEYEVVCYA